MAENQVDQEVRRGWWRHYFIIGIGILFTGLVVSALVYFWDEMQDAAGYGYAGGFLVSIMAGITIIPAPALPVIFTPHGVASALIPGLAVAFNGKVVLEGASPIGDKLGNRVFDDKIHLADDATLAYRPASRPFDDEAVTSRRTPLIEAGRVSGFLYDLKTAAQARTESTGNGRRGGGLPSPSPSAFIIAPGETAFEDMVADIKEGLIVEYLMGASQGNILGGDFSGNVLLGYKIESGKIVGRVKDTMVSGNIYQALKKVAAIGSDDRGVGGSLKTPSIYCSGLSVASK